MIVVGRWFTLAFAAGLSLSALGIQFSESDRASLWLVPMLGAWSVVAYLGYRRARTVRAIEARLASDGSGRGNRVAVAAAGAGAVGATLAQAFSEEASGVPLVVTLAWLALGFATGALWHLVRHGDGARSATELSPVGRRPGP